MKARTIAMLAMVLAGWSQTAGAATVLEGTPFALIWDNTNAVADEVTGYTVYEMVGGQALLAERSVGTAMRVPITPRPIGDHVYVVTALSVDGEESEWSAPVTVTVTPLVIPIILGQVLGVTGTLVNRSLTLSWQARPANEGVTRYIVNGALNGGGRSTNIVFGTTLALRGLPRGVHIFDVRAATATAEGPRSSGHAVNIVRRQPRPPAGLRVTTP